MSIRGSAVRHLGVAAPWQRANPANRELIVKYMLLVIGNQDIEAGTAEEGQSLMEAFMAYHKAV